MCSPLQATWLEALVMSVKVCYGCPSRISSWHTKKQNTLKCKNWKFLKLDFIWLLNFTLFFLRDIPPVQTGPGAHPASCTMGTGFLPGVKYGRGVLLTTHHFLVPRSWKSRAIPLSTLWATTGPVTGTLYLYQTGSGNQPTSYLTFWRRNYFFNFSTHCI